ncbi:MAG: FAD-dependent oxidoreductase [Bacilli bacterium]
MRKLLYNKNMNTNFEIIILGGGIAGVSAAISAARENKKVAIIERSALLGGLATIGLIHWYEPLCSGEGKQIIYSQAEELLKLSIKYGYKTVDDSWLNTHHGERRYSTWFNPNLFALSLTKLLNELNVTIFFESEIIGLNKKDNIIESVDIHTIEGMIRLTAKVFIDATGNASPSKSVGLKTRNGVNYLTYATTTYEKGLDKPVFKYTGAGLDGKNHPEGVRLFTNANQDDVNEYLLTGQLLALKEYEQGIKKDLSILPSMSQFRKISMVEGDYLLTNDDLYKYHEDSIGVISVFNRIKQWYEIPIGCLYNSKIKNLLFAGRIISSYDDAWEATRVIPVAALTGEVSGIIASTLINEGKINLKTINEIEVKRGIKLHYKDCD